MIKAPIFHLIPRCLVEGENEKNNFKRPLGMKGCTSVTQSGCIQPGVKPCIAQAITSNLSFCAYMSPNAVFVYSLPEFRAISMISSSLRLVTGLSIAPGQSPLIIISYSDNKNIIFDCRTSITQKSFQTQHFIVGLEWSQDGKDIYCFSTFFSIFNIYHYDQNVLEEVSIENLMNLRHFCLVPNKDKCLIGGNHNGRVSYINIETKMHQYDEKDQKVRGVCIDPRNEDHCLCVWERSWTCYEITDSMVRIANHDDEKLTFGAACYLEKPFGHFMTGDSSMGIVRIWSPASDEPVESYTVHQYGFRGMKTISRNRIACSFEDGMFGVLCLKKRELIFQNAAGHSAAIIGCCFSPSNTNSLITASCEGSICIWDTKSLEQVDRIVNRHQNKYLSAMDVSNGGGFAAVGYSNGKIAFYSFQTHKKLFTAKIHSEKIISVQFNIKRANYLLISSKSKDISLFDVETKRVISRFPVIGTPNAIACSPHSAALFVVGTHEGNIYIISDKTEVIDVPNEIIKTICFSPYDNSLIAAATASSKVLVYNMKKKKMMFIYNYGSGKPSSMCWNRYMQNILLIGTTSGSVLVLDIHKQKKIYQFHAHYGPIRKLVFNQLHPFEFITVSSDITIKKWEIDKLFFPLEVNSLLLKDEEHCMSFFRPLDGYGTINSLTKYLSNKGEKCFDEEETVVHFEHALEHAKERSELLIRNQDVGTIMKRAIQRKRVLHDAARICLHSGNVQQYCEFVFAAGDYDKAIAMAPAVSISFWKELMDQKTKQQNDEISKVQLYLITGKINEAIKILLENNKGDAAFTVSCADAEDLYIGDEKFAIQPPKPKQIPKIPIDLNTNHFLYEYSVVQEKAQYHRLLGQPLLAAAAYMSIGDMTNALIHLMRDGELFYAMEIDLSTDFRLIPLRERFVKFCIAHNCGIEDAFSILDIVSKKKLAAMVEFEKKPERFAFFKIIGLIPLDEPASTQETIHFHLLNGDITEGVTLCIATLKDILSKPAWDWFEVRELVEELELCNLKYVSAQLRNESIAIALYVAMFEAMWKGYVSIVDPLREKLEQLIKENDIAWLRPKFYQMTLAQKLSNHTKSGIRINCTGFDSINVKLDNDGEPIRKGPVFILGSKGENMLMQTALKWFDITPFSPLLNGDIFFMY